MHRTGGQTDERLPRLYHHPRAAKHLAVGVRPGVLAHLARLPVGCAILVHGRRWERRIPGGKRAGENAGIFACDPRDAGPTHPSDHERLPKIRTAGPDVARAGSVVIRFSGFRTVERLALAAHGLGFQDAVGSLGRGRSAAAHGHVVGDGEQQRDGGDAAMIRPADRSRPRQRRSLRRQRQGPAQPGPQLPSVQARSEPAGFARWWSVRKLHPHTAHRQQLGHRHIQVAVQRRPRLRRRVAQRYTAGRLWCSVAPP